MASSDEWALVRASAMGADFFARGLGLFHYPLQFVRLRSGNRHVFGHGIRDIRLSKQSVIVAFSAEHELIIHMPDEHPLERDSRFSQDEGLKRSVGNMGLLHPSRRFHF